MKTVPLATSIASLYFLPDTEGAPAGGSTPAPAPAPTPAPAPAAPATDAKPIPAGESPTGSPIPVVRRPMNKPPVIVQPQPAGKETPPGPPQRKIVDVKKALGLKENPSESLAKQAAEIRKRNERGQFVPTPPVKLQGQAEPEPEPEPAPTPTPEPEPTPAPAPTPTPAPVQKIKIGEKELTPDEVVAHIAELEKKVTKPDATPAATAKPEPTEAEAAAERKKIEDDFIAAEMADFGIDDKAFDQMVTDGNYTGLRRALVQRELRLRTWVQDTLNPILRDIFAAQNDASGAVKMYQEVEQYRAEEAFYKAHPDLKPHMDKVRNIRDALARKYPQEWEKMTPEERDEQTAKSVKAIYGASGLVQPATAAPAPAPAPKPKPKPAPPTGQVSNGGTIAPADRGFASPARLIAKGK